MVRLALRVALLLLAAAAAQAQTAITATVTAIRATATDSLDTTYDATSAAFKDALEPLDFDSFATVKTERVDLSAEAEFEVSINERYTLRFGNTQTQDDGHVMCRVTVYGKPKNGTEPVKVLQMNVRLAPGRPVMIRGLRIDEGEIIAFIERD